MKVSLQCLLVMLLAVTMAPAAWAVGALSAAEPASRAERHQGQYASPEGFFCGRYFKGFIDFEIVTNEWAMDNMLARDAVRAHYPASLPKTGTA